MKITLFDTPLSFDAPSPRNPNEYPHVPKYLILLETRIIDLHLPLGYAW